MLKLCLIVVQVLSLPLICAALREGHRTATHVVVLLFLRLVIQILTCLRFLLNIFGN